MQGPTERSTLPCTTWKGLYLCLSFRLCMALSLASCSSFNVSSSVISLLRSPKKSQCFILSVVQLIAETRNMNSALASLSSRNFLQTRICKGSVGVVSCFAADRKTCGALSAVLLWNSLADGVSQSEVWEWKSFLWVFPLPPASWTGGLVLGG